MRPRWPRLLNPTHLSQLIHSQKNPLKALVIFNEAKSRYPSYRHNGSVYATMIIIPGSSGHVAEMKEIVYQMKEDSCEFQDSLFASVIRTYANGGIEARILLSLFVDNCQGWEIKSRTRALKLLMNTLCKMHGFDLALHVVFQEVNYQWCYPDRDTYKTLMKGLCDDGRLNEATNLLYSMFWRISQKGCGADVSVYRKLLESLCDNEQIGEAVELLKKVLQKGLKAPKKYFKFTDELDIDYVKALINEALIKGGIPSSDGYKAPKDTYVYLVEGLCFNDKYVEGS
ncbi:hypothetical protein ACS0TY_035627 [Phlomoides rotata]